MLDQRILLIGGGNMGRALLRGWIDAGVTKAANVHVVDVADAILEQIESEFGVATSKDVMSKDGAAAAKDAEIILLAVKPFTLNAVLDALSSTVRSEQIVMSIIAGVEAGYIREKIGKSNPVVRCMPNIGATVFAAASAICGCGIATEEHLDVAETIFGAVGEVVRVAENQIDAVTGVSGSGPAYIYMVIEALSDGGVNMGLPRDVALKLATATVAGAAKLVAETGEHPAVLKERVTTPGGTTIAAIQELEERGLRAMFMSAVEAATERSRFLNEQTKSE